MFQPETFQDTLCRLRKAHGLTQTELADQLYLSMQAISKWERGESVPDISHLCRLSELFGVSVDVLVGNYSQTERTLIAVDGGGTKTEFVLITQQGMLLKRLVLSGANPNLAGMEHALRVLREGIDAMLRVGTEVVGIFVGCAGMGTGNNARTAEAALAAVYPKTRVKCTTDIENVLACADDSQNSIAVISGTGSVVYARCGDQLIRAGGGGTMLEKLGSGYDLGRAALSAALEHRDGTGPETSLTAAVEQRLGGTVWSCVQELYKKEPAYIASFAPLVLQAWEAGDAIASSIVEENCARLAHLIHVCAKKAPEAEVLLAGSLLVKNDKFRGRLLALLDPRLRAHVMDLPQVWGACLACAALCELPKPSQETFLQQYEQVCLED